MNPILKAILVDRPVAYHPHLAKAVGSVTAGLFLSQLLYWSDKGSEPEGWIWKTQEDWREEIGLSRREQETARKHLVSLDVLEEQRRSIPAKLYYRINFDALTRLLEQQTRMAESANQECTKAPNWNGGKRQSNSEITSETTTESPPVIPLQGDAPHAAILQNSSKQKVQSQKVKPAAPVPPKPEWFGPVEALEGYKEGSHAKAIEIIRLTCEAWDVEPASVVTEFARYWPGGRIKHGWTDPVATLVRTREVQIRKVKEPERFAQRNGKLDLHQMRLEVERGASSGRPITHIRGD